jgi:phosphatidylglycerophosphate synthase
LNPTVEFPVPLDVSTKVLTPRTHERIGRVRAVQIGLIAVMTAELLLLAGLALTVGLGRAGWTVGIAACVLTNVALAVGFAYYRSDRLGPAEWVTLIRATLVVGIAALVADSFEQPAAVTTFVGLSFIALALDAVDGYVARRTGTASALGAKFDGEVDAFLILVLSVYVASTVGPWVLLFGAIRYLYAAGEWLLPWMRAPLPPRYWRKVVAATVGITLTVVAWDVLPGPLNLLALFGAMGMLFESFGRDVLYLWRRRDSEPAPVLSTAEDETTTPPPARRRGPVRIALGVVLTTLALLVVWAALVAPDNLRGAGLDRFARVPLEGIAIVALAILLPRTGRRFLAALLGFVLGLLLLVKLLDTGFLAGFDRRFNPVEDWSYTSLGIETLRDTIGRTQAYLLVAAIVLVIVLVLVVPVLAMVRVTKVAARHRRWSLGILAALAMAWGIFWIAGAQVVAGAPVASTSAAYFVAHEGQSVQVDLRARAAFGRDLGHDRFRATPGNQLLTGLRGKDVMLVFVESYGKVAVQGSAFSPAVDQVLDQGTQQLQNAGYTSRSAWLTSPTFGGISWLAHSTMQSGVWTDGQGRYDKLVTSGRFTLSKAFKRAGWRTVDVAPAQSRNWPEGFLLYGYDKVYDRRNLGYRGPGFSYAPMPDQFVLNAFQKNELSAPNRKPLFAELDLVSSHTPWTKIPQMVPWDQLGDGTIFNSIPVSKISRAALFNDPPKARQAYGQSVRYTMTALFSFLQQSHDPNLVLVVLGDHQPSAIITGPAPSHDVPVSVISKDPKVFQQIDGWGWQNGMRPDAAAPVAPMSVFRDRFLTAFGSQPAS